MARNRQLSVRLSAEGWQQLDALTTLLRWTQVEVIEEALHALYDMHFPKDTPAITTWQPVILAQDAICSDLGMALSRGTHAYQEVWSDGRVGAIVSREALVRDGILFDTAA